MWRCQREKLKEDAIQCCGKKDCEKKFLDSVPPVPPAHWETYDTVDADGHIESSSNPRCINTPKRGRKETKFVPGICYTKLTDELCTDHGYCDGYNTTGGGILSGGITGSKCLRSLRKDLRMLVCDKHHGGLCLKWDPTNTPISRYESVVSYKCVLWKDI